MTTLKIPRIICGHKDSGKQTLDDGDLALPLALASCVVVWRKILRRFLSCDERVKNVASTSSTQKYSTWYDRYCSITLNHRRNIITLGTTYTRPIERQACRHLPLLGRLHPVINEYRMERPYRLHSTTARRRLRPRLW